MTKINLADLELPDDVLEIIETRNADVPLEVFLAVLIQLGAPTVRKIIAQLQECEERDALKNQTRH